MDGDLINLANHIASELRAMMIPNVQLYRTGNMKGSVTIVTVDDNFVDIVIATDYASFTNTRGRHAGWVEKTVDRACRAYASNNKVDNANLTGQIISGEL